MRSVLRISPIEGVQWVDYPPSRSSVHDCRTDDSDPGSGVVVRPWSWSHVVYLLVTDRRVNRHLESQALKSDPRPSWYGFQNSYSGQEQVIVSTPVCPLTGPCKPMVNVDRPMSRSGCVGTLVGCPSICTPTEYTGSTRDARGQK